MKRNSYRTWLFLATIFGGSLLPGTCEIRIHDALINGSKAFLASALDPANLLPEFSTAGEIVDEADQTDEEDVQELN